METLTFSGGLHPHDAKELTRDRPISVLEPPKKLTLLMSQHIGAPAKPCVAVGDMIMAGQMVGEAGGFVSAPVHSPVSGKVLSIDNAPHPMGKRSLAIVVENDEKYQWLPTISENDSYNALSPGELLELVKKAGIVGLGGATFPTHVKLSPPKDKAIELVIVNGAECEPYLTNDYRLMLEKPEEITEGLKIVMRILSVEKGVMGIENNKPPAISSMKNAIRDDNRLSVQVLETKYPQGAELQLITAITDKEVPSGGLPMDIGVVVVNVGTCLAIYEAVKRNRPLVERIVTVTGYGIKEPKNLKVSLGTPFSHIIEHCGGFSEAPGKVIMGGPMMGIAQFDLSTPLVKCTSGILVLPREIISDIPASACIRCGKCVDHCPMRLLPQKLSLLVEYERPLETEAYGVFDCKECGCCSYICPAKRPIVHQVKFAKSMIASDRAKKRAIEEARKENS